MNINAVINQLSLITGASREQVIDALGKMNNIPEVRKYLEKKANDKKGRKAGI